MLQQGGYAQNQNNTNKALPYTKILQLQILLKNLHHRQRQQHLP